MPTTWFRYSLVYFLFTAAAGVVLRGMAFLPSWQVKYEPLLHAHSHLALLGWGYTALVLLLATRFLTPEDGRSRFLRINWLLTQLTIAGMFIAFLLQGYGLFSIMFSTIHILLSYALAVWMWRKLGKRPGKPLSVRFAKAGLALMVLSSLGPWTLAVLSARQLNDSPWYHAALYFYLHCQYNGWFTLGLFALLYSLLEQTQAVRLGKLAGFHYWAYTISVLPSFVLSLLWMKLSAVWVVIAAVSGAAGLAAVAAFLLLGLRNRAVSRLGFSGWPRAFLYVSLTALIVKMVLELGSALPALEPLVFSTRSIVIGYLHLVLLGFVSFLLLALIFRLNGLDGNQKKTGSLLLLAGFLLNEAVLFLDGLLQWLHSAGLPLAAQLLLAASLLMFAGICALQRPLFAPRGRSQS